MSNAANDPIATLDELRALDPLADDQAYPDDVVLTARDAVIETLEHACRTAFVRREFTQTFAHTSPMGVLALEWGIGRRHSPPAVTACAVNGVDLDADALAAIGVGRGGAVQRTYDGFGNACTITYTAGWDTPPGRVRRVVRLLTRDWLIDNDNLIPSRATRWEAGENTYTLITAGVRDALFDLPEANALVKQYRE